MSLQLSVIVKGENETISASERTDLYAAFCSLRTARPLSQSQHFKPRSFPTTVRLHYMGIHWQKPSHTRRYFCYLLHRIKTLFKIKKQVDWFRSKANKERKKTTPKINPQWIRNCCSLRNLFSLALFFVLLFTIQIQLECQKMADKSLETMHAIWNYFCQ